MAQTKTRRSSSSSRSGGSSRGSTKSRSSSRGSANGRSRSGSTKARSGAKQTTKRTTRAASSNNGSQSTLTKVVSKAKGPMIAGGAALAGLAGGAALARNGSRKGFMRGVSLPSLPKPSFGDGESVSKALGSAAKGLGKAGLAAGELATEVRKAREEMNGK